MKESARLKAAARDEQVAQMLGTSAPHPVTSQPGSRIPVALCRWPSSSPEEHEGDGDEADAIGHAPHPVQAVGAAAGQGRRASGRLSAD